MLINKLFSDPCTSRTTLSSGGTPLVNLCYMSSSLTWPAARQKCLENSMRLFEISTLSMENTMFNYLKTIATGNQFFWINGIAAGTSPSNWFVEDPQSIWTYSSNNWYGVFQAPVPGFCLGVTLISNNGKFTQKGCSSFQSSFWCQY